MAVKITNLIGPRIFELVRDKIGLIISVELPNQAVLAGDPELNAKVFKERFVPVNASEGTIVNVQIPRGDYGMITALNQDGNYVYYIDCYVSAKSTNDNRGDELAMVKLQRLTGIIQAILSDGHYRTLDFPRPLIEHTSVENIQFADAEDTKDAASLVRSRITFIVRAPEEVEELPVSVLDGLDTSVTLDDTDEGYVFINNDT